MAGEVIDRKSVITSFESDLKDLEAGVAAAKRLINGVIEVNKKAGEAAKKGAEEMKKFNFEASQLGQAITNSLGPVGNVIVKITSGVLSLLQSLKGAAVAARLFGVALISTGIGALVVAVSALGAAFLNTQRGADALTRTIEPLKAVFSSLLSTVEDLGTAMVNAFQGSGTFLSDIQEIGKNLSENLTKAAIQGKIIANIDIQKDKLLTKQNLQQTLLNNQLSRQQEILNTSTNEPKVRLAAAAEILKLTQQKADVDLKIVDLDLKRAKINNLLNDGGRESQKEIFDLTAKRLEIENSVQDKQTQLAKKISEIKKEEIAAAKRAAAEAERAEKARIKAIQDARKESGELNPVTDILTTELVVFERQLGDLNKALQAAFEIDDNEAIESIRQVIRSLEAEIQAFKVRAGDQSAIDQYLGLGKEAKDSTKKGLDTFFKELADKQAAANKATADKAQKDQAAIDEENARKRTENIENLTDSLQSAATGAIEALNNINQAQIDQFNNAINLQTERVSRFEELAKTGSARQLIIEEERLEKMEAARARAVEKQQRLAAAQILINQAVTISESIKAIASAFGTGGPLGIVTGIAMTAALGIALAGVASNVSGLFGSIPAFAKGIESLEGPGTGTSDSIMARLSKGERVTDASTNKKVNMAAKGVFPNKLLPDAVRAYMSTPEISAAMYGLKDATDRGFKELIGETQMMRAEFKRLKITILAKDHELAAMVSQSNMTDAWKKNG